MFELKEDIDKSIYNLFRRGSIGTFVLKILNIILVFGTNFLLARFIGAKQYGIYAYVISCSSILSILSLFGLHMLVVREVSIYKTKNDWSSFYKLFRWSTKMVLFSSLLFSIMGGAMLSFLSKKQSLYDFSTAIWFGMILVPLVSFIYLYQGILRGLGYIVKAQVPLFLILPVVFLILILFSSQLITLNGILVIKFRIIATILSLAIAILFLKFLLKERSIKTSVCQQNSPLEWLKSALPLFIFTTAEIMNQRISVVVLGNLLGPKEAGIFDITFKLAKYVDFPFMIINMPLAPIIARFYVKNEYTQLQKLITHSTRIAFLFSLLFVLFLICYGNKILLLVGKEFSHGYYALIILSLGFLINVSMGPAILLLNMTKNEAFVAKVIVTFALINLLLNITLVPKFGLIGAAVANSIVIMSWNFLLSIIVYKKLSIYSSILGKRFLKLFRGVI